MMVDLEDEADWSTSDEIEEEDSDRYYSRLFITEN